MEKTIRETPDSVCAKIVEMAAISDSMCLLEPSAGNGKILSYINDNYSFNNITYTAIELNKEKCDILSSKLPIVNLIRGDFLNITAEDFLQNNSSDGFFDRIIACPPFKGNIDVVHIEKMYTHLRSKGLIVSLTSPYWLTNNEKHQVKFREWLSDKDYYIRMLPDNSFMEKGKSVPTAIMKIYKK